MINILLSVLIIKGQKISMLKQSNMVLKRPDKRSYMVKQVVCVTNGSSVERRSLSNLISFRMKEHAMSYKQMLLIVNPQSTFIVESISDIDNLSSIIYDSEMNPCKTV